MRRRRSSTPTGRAIAAAAAVVALLACAAGACAARPPDGGVERAAAAAGDEARPGEGAGGETGSGTGAAGGGGQGESGGPRLAVIVPESAPEVAAAIRDGWFVRWAARRAGARVEVGPEAAGDTRIAAALWPLPAGLRDLAAALPVELDRAVPTLGGTAYPEAEVAVALRLPGDGGGAGGEGSGTGDGDGGAGGGEGDPTGGGGPPGWLVTGRRPEAVADLAGQVLAWQLGSGRGRGESFDPSTIDFLVRETPWVERSGRWRPAAGGGLEVDPATDRDGFAERRRWFERLEPVRPPGGRWVELRVPPGTAGRSEHLRLAAELERAAAAMAPRVPLPGGAPADPVVVVVEPDFPTQARHTGRIGAAVGGGPADLHLVLHPDDLFAYRHALAGALIGRSEEIAELPPALARGAALWLSGDWYGRGWRDWLPPLAAAGAFPDAAELLAAEDPADASPPLWTPAAAAVVDALAGDTLTARLAAVPGPRATAALLAAAERRAAAAGAADDRAGASARPAGERRAPAPFLHGVSLAMLNSLDGGYHAPAIDRELERLAGLGADAVSLMPFAYQSAPDRPEIAFLNRGPSSETDVGVIHAARRAHARGMSVLWKPHLWLSWESWPGDVAMRSEADWRAWWRVYRRYVLHHALLAGWTGSELFSVGVELSATVEREAEWRRLIADVRRLYPGKVTYSANWHGDAERVGFWDALDLAGVDAYFPLAVSPDAGPDELAAGARGVAERLAAIARAADRPLLLTEVGFPARRGAWVKPHVEGGDASAADQAAAYRALLTALGHPPWLAGGFVWKAFSGPVDRGDRPDFRFLDRPAEAEVARWFAAR